MDALHRSLLQETLPAGGLEVNAAEHYRIAEQILIRIKAFELGDKLTPDSAAEMRDEARLHLDLACTYMMAQKCAGLDSKTIAGEWQAIFRENRK